MVNLPNYFWCPTGIVLPNGHHVDHHLPDTKKKTNFIHSAGLRYEAIACRDQIMSGKTEHPFMTLEHSLQIARIIEEARKQVLAPKNLEPKDLPPKDLEPKELEPKDLAPKDLATNE